MTTTARVWDPDDLWARIGPLTIADDVKGDDTYLHAGRPPRVPYGDLPRAVRDVLVMYLERGDVNRDKACFRIVKECQENGLTLDQTLGVVQHHYPPSVDKFGSRLPQFVRKYWNMPGAQLPRLARSSTESYADYMTAGGSFIFDAPDRVPALWGNDEGVVLWAQGQPLMVTGPIGVGKTTLSAQLTEARLGLRDEVLGFAIKPGNRKVLYLAMDRPLQIRGALGRTLKRHSRRHLDERLIAWQGPPPEDLARSPDLLHALALAADADTIIVDSLKDAVTKLTDDETGGGWNRAVQKCIAAGIEVVVLHHQRKAGSGDSGKPKTVNDVYGSVWFTAGMGSILLLWGEPGAARIELSHLRPPALPLSAIWVHHDHTAGSMTPESDAEDVLSSFTTPRTVQDLAVEMFGDKQRANVEKARREVAKLVAARLLREDQGPRRPGGGKPAKYYVLAAEATNTR